MNYIAFEPKRLALAGAFLAVGTFTLGVWARPNLMPTTYDLVYVDRADNTHTVDSGLSLSDCVFGAEAGNRLNHLQYLTCMETEA